MNHVPVLALVPKLYKIKSVLSYNAGVRSSDIFTDNTLYKDVERITLVSTVIDKNLYEKDKRVEFRTTMPASIYSYDLIFLQQMSTTDRLDKVIGYVMWSPDKTLRSSIIVIRGVNYDRFKKEINSKYYKYIFKYDPVEYIGLYHNSPVKKLTKANNLIKKWIGSYDEVWSSWGNLWDKNLKRITR